MHGTEADWGEGKGSGGGGGTPSSSKVSFFGGEFWVNLGYHIYSKYSRLLLFTVQQVHFLYYILVNVCKIAGCVANRIDLDQTPHSVVSDLGECYLLRPVCPNALSKYEKKRKKRKKNPEETVMAKR